MLCIIQSLLVQHGTVHFYTNFDFLTVQHQHHIQSFFDTKMKRCIFYTNFDFLAMQRKHSTPTMMQQHP